MKNLFTRLMLVAVAAMGIVACQTEPVIYVPEVNTFDMTIIADGDTRTELDGTSINWSAGDKLSVVVNNSIKTSNALDSATTTASFTVKDVTASDSGYTIQAVYPADAIKEARGAEYPNVYRIETATKQTPSTTSFDSAADMLVAKEVTTTEQPSELIMQFTRLVALGEMTLTEFTPESDIKSVTFSTSDTALTGRSNVNLSTTEVEYGYTNQASKDVILSYSGDEVWGDAYKIYFTCFPAELTTFTVVVEAVDGTKYTKKVKLNDKTLSFTAGDMTRFKVNMEGTKVVIADNTDVLDRDFTGVTSTSYTAWSDKTALSTAVYAGNSAGGNESIQLRSNNSNSGIVTTASAGKVTKVVVDWNSNTASGRTLNIYGKNTAYDAATDLYDSNKQGTLLGTIVNGTSTELIIDGVYQYIGLCSNSGAMYLSEIQITWAEITADDVVPAEPLAMPSDMKAEVTENTIKVSWAAVTGAIGYEVSIDGDANKTDTTVGTSYEFTDLTAGTEYTISVVALGNGKTTTDSDIATIKATPKAEVIVASYSYTFTEKKFSANGTLDLDGLNWTLAGDGGYWAYDTNKGQHLGSGSKPYKTLTLSTSDFNSEVNKIVLETSGGSSVNATCTITVGGTQIGDAIKITSTSTEYTFEATAALKGEIVISYSQTSSKAIYIKKIEIN